MGEGSSLRLNFVLSVKRNWPSLHWASHAILSSSSSLPNTNHYYTLLKSFSHLISGETIIQVGSCKKVGTMVTKQRKLLCSFSPRDIQPVRGTQLPRSLGIGM